MMIGLNGLRTIPTTNIETGPAGNPTIDPTELNRIGKNTARPLKNTPTIDE